MFNKLNKNNSKEVLLYKEKMYKESPKDTKSSPD